MIFFPEKVTKIMAEAIKLSAVKRDVKEKSKAIRRAGFIPGVVYGPSIKPYSVKVEAVAFDKVFAQAGESHLIELALDGSSSAKVIVKDMAMDVVKDKPIHIDFYQVDMAKKIHTEIALHFIGESKAVKELGATLVKTYDALRVECLPDALVDFIEVDLSALVVLGDFIRVKDLKLPAGIKSMDEEDAVLVSSAEMHKEKEVAPAPAAEAAPVSGQKPAANQKKGEKK